MKRKDVQVHQGLSEIKRLGQTSPKHLSPMNMATRSVLTCCLCNIRSVQLFWLVHTQNTSFSVTSQSCSASKTHATCSCSPLHLSSYIAVGDQWAQPLSDVIVLSIMLGDSRIWKRVTSLDAASGKVDLLVMHSRTPMYILDCRPLSITISLWQLLTVRTWRWLAQSSWIVSNMLTANG